MNYEIKKVTVWIGPHNRSGHVINACVETFDGISENVCVPVNSIFYSFNNVGFIERISKEISERLCGTPVFSQEMVDEILEAFEFQNELWLDNYNVTHLITLAVSIAVMRLSVSIMDVPLEIYLGGVRTKSLPLPCMNMISTGKHAQWQSSDFQEYMIIPKGNDDYWSEKWFDGEKIHQKLGALMQEKGIAVNLHTDGSFIPVLKSNQEPLILLEQAIENAGFKVGDDVEFAINPAATEFYVEGKYKVNSEGLILKSSEMVEYYEKLVKKFPIVIIESGLANCDYSGMKKMNQKLGEKIKIVADDLYVYWDGRSEKRNVRGLTNSATINPYKFKTITEIINAIGNCWCKKVEPFISIDDISKDDVFISELIFSLGGGYIKTVAPMQFYMLNTFSYLINKMNG